jgi:hypothetical protein
MEFTRIRFQLWVRYALAEADVVAEQWLALQRF